MYLHHYVQPFLPPQDRAVLSYSRRLRPEPGCLEQPGLRDQVVEPTHADGFIRLAG